MNLPSWLNPVIFQIGVFRLHWYSLAYVIGFISSFAYSYSLVKRHNLKIKSASLEGMYNFIVFGTIIGGRLGYVFLYDFSHYIRYPAEILMIWRGGMSFHGAFLGIIVFGFIACKKYSLNYSSMFDIGAAFVPFGVLLGRLANFVNGELWGRATTLPIGVIFPNSPTLEPRHPSQLYEAVIEGLIPLILFIFLTRKTNILKIKRMLVSIYVVWYAVGRFCIEFFREPDAQVGLIFNVVSMGQILSIIMIITITIIAIINKDYIEWKKLSLVNIPKRKVSKKS